MKKIFVLFCLCLTACVFFSAKGRQAVTTNDTTYQIYFVDRKLHKLIPTAFETKSQSSKKIAREIIESIIDGRDYNPEILRIIPNMENLITIHVKKDCAYIDISGELRGKITKNKENERLFIYQLVNSVTSIPEISFVQFTIDEKKQKDFLGFLDMREIFKPDYDI